MNAGGCAHSFFMCSLCPRRVEFSGYLNVTYAAFKSYWSYHKFRLVNSVHVNIQVKLSHIDLYLPDTVNSRSTSAVFDCLQHVLVSVHSEWKGKHLPGQICKFGWSPVCELQWSSASVRQTEYLHLSFGGGVVVQPVWSCWGAGVQAGYGWACLLPATPQRLSYGSCRGCWSVTCGVPPSSDPLSECAREYERKANIMPATQNTLYVIIILIPRENGKKCAKASSLNCCIRGSSFTWRRYDPSLTHWDYLYVTHMTRELNDTWEQIRPYDWLSVTRGDKVLPGNRIKSWLSQRPSNAAFSRHWSVFILQYFYFYWSKWVEHFIRWHSGVTDHVTVEPDALLACIISMTLWH